MEKGKEYLCTLKPLDIYFLGGERNFQFGKAKSSDKVEYYLKSEYLPQQSTLVGMLRFMMLSKAGLLNEDGFVRDDIVRAANREKNASHSAAQDELIGKSGFHANAKKALEDYGKLYEVGPLFVVKRTEDGNHRLVRTPLNHKKGADVKSYQPFHMKSGYRTGNGNNMILPIDYCAKDGIEDSYIDIDDGGRIYGIDEIFGEKEHTRIGRSLDEDGYFKMMYRYLKDGYSFGFYSRIEEDTLPENGITCIGQGKSAFDFQLTGTEGNGMASLLDSIHNLPGCPDVSVYLALSDLFMDIGEKDECHFRYSIVENKTFRTLNHTEAKDDYLTSRKKSKLFQLVRAGSVFYINPSEEDYFLSMLDQPGLKQVGFNYAVKMGGNAK